MIRRLRLAILLFVPLLFWAVSIVLPGVVQAEHLRYLSTTFGAVWTIVIFFLGRLGGLTNLDALPSNHLQVIQLRLDYTRSRMWWMAGVSAVCSFAIWFLTTPQLVGDPQTLAVMVGVLFAICASYMVIVLFWINDLHRFQDDLKVSAADKVKRDAELKSLADAAKAK